jgi:hypothetical protein
MQRIETRKARADDHRVQLLDFLPGVLLSVAGHSPLLSHAAVLLLSITDRPEPVEESFKIAGREIIMDLADIRLPTLGLFF